MRKLFIIISLFLVVNIGKAQIATWLIHPEYDQIELLDDNLLKGEKDGKIIFWNLEAEKLLEMSDVTLNLFREDLAVLCEKGTNTVSGIVNKRGELIDLSQHKYQIDNDYPYFSCGYLLVRKGNYLYYLDKKGNEIYGPYVEAYPFLDNMACVKYCIDPVKKPHEAYWTYISIVPGETFLTDGSNNIKPENIKFCSSFNYGYAIVMIDKTFYKFRNDTKTLDQLYTSVPVTKKTRVMSVEKEVDMQRSDSTVTVVARNAVFYFDRFMRLVKYQYVDQPEQSVMITTKDFIPTVKKDQTYMSDFEAFGNTRKYGLNYNGNVLLPPQFDNVDLVKDKIAVVTVDGKKGIITADDDSKIEFRFNNGEHIGFMHQFYTAKVSVSLPPTIKSKTAVVMTKQFDCEILRETRQEYDNVEGSTLEYNCRLQIPSDLTDTLSFRKYYMTVKYDGLLSVDHEVTAMEWFVKYYDVNLAKSEFTAAPTDTITVEFNLVKSAMAGVEEANFYKNVEVISPVLSGSPVLTKLSENSFSFDLTGIEIEKLPFTVRITETGCPSVDYPFELTITKPETKQRTRVRRTVSTPSSSSSKQVKKTTPATPSIIMPK